MNYTCPKCGKHHVSAVNKYNYKVEKELYGVVLSETKKRGEAEITEAVAIHFPHNRYCWDCDYEWEEGIEDE